MTAPTRVTIMAGQTNSRKEPSVTHRKGRKRNILSIQVSTGKAETSFLPEIQQSMSFNTGLN